MACVAIEVSDTVQVSASAYHQPAAYLIEQTNILVSLSIECNDMSVINYSAVDNKDDVFYYVVTLGVV